MFARFWIVVCMVTLMAMANNCGGDEQPFSSFLNDHVTKASQLFRDRNLAYWQATASGEKEAYDRYARLDLEVKQMYGNRDDFARLKAWMGSSETSDSLLARQMKQLYNSYLENQIDTALVRQMVELAAAVEAKFNTFRGAIDGNEVSTKEIYEMLRTETDWNKRQKAWEASMQVGPLVQPDLVRLVKLRNTAARQLGYDNYYVMALTLNEQDEQELVTLFQGLAEATEEPYKAIKAEVDSILARKYGINPDMMRPWGYNDPFFQEVPKVADVSLDAFYQNRDIKELAVKYLESIGLEVTDIIARSDLYEREGKFPHAYCTDIDREGDIRIMANLMNDEYEMDTILHELGHGIYDKYIDPSLPYLLRGPAHAFTTEAMAVLLGRLAHNANWLYAMGLITAEERDRIHPTIDRSLRMGQIVFARWCLVMFHFERELYRNPDTDLNTLWWDLKETYQFLTRPEDRNEPDWAAKIHFTIAPVYYHNYMIGEMTASQFHAYMAGHILKTQDRVAATYVNRPEVGSYMKERIFRPGARYEWNDLLIHATGEPLNPSYFVKQFVTAAGAE